MPRIIALGLIFLAATAATVVPAAAQYPDRPVTILTGYPAGGMVDITVRALSEGLKKKFPKGIGIVTRPGAGGSLAVAELVQAKPDGYTIILAPLSTLVIQSVAIINGVRPSAGGGAGSRPPTWRPRP